MDEIKMNQQDHVAATNAVKEITDKLESLDTQSDSKEQDIKVEKSTQQSRQEEQVKETRPVEEVPPVQAAAAEEAAPPPITLPKIISQCNKDEYLVKTIDWKDKKVRIITQNENGPCPLVAICNVLFLRGDLDIQPPDREVVTFEYLVERLGDYLLNHAPTDDYHEASPIVQEPASTIETTTTAETTKPHKLEKRQATSEFVLTYRHNLDTALSILPNLKSGLDVNVKFDNIHGFEPTAELAMFDLFDVDLVHGWVADPQDIETNDVIVRKCGTYNHTVECIVRADELNSARSRVSASASDSTTENKTPAGIECLTVAEEEKLHQAFIASEFLKNTATQLTYYGLDLLLDSIPVDTLCVLFRNNHFSTVYRHAKSGLYMLVTDSGLVLERSIIWESLGDVDQSSSEFYDGCFSKPKIPQQPQLPPINRDEQQDLDYAIAVSIQDEQKRQQRNSYYQSSNSSSPSHVAAGSAANTTGATGIKSNSKRKSESKCIIS